MKMLRFVMAVVLGLSLAGGGVAVPAYADPKSAAAASGSDWTDEEAQWYRDSVVDIAMYAAEPEVRDAATAALTAGTTQAIGDFVDSGWAQARLAATQRKSRDKAQVTTWSRTGGTNVQRLAKQALAGGDYTIGEFVAYGYELADRLDDPVADTQPERDRIYQRVERMIAMGGPTVVADGSAALASADPAVIAAFYTTGYAAANRADWDNRERVRVAIEQRNESIDLLTANASAAETGARARAEILAANIQGLAYLESSLLAMRQAAAAANAADQVFEQDRVNRPRQPGRTALLEAHKADAIAQADRATQTALQMNAVIARVQIATRELADAGQDYGHDWAQVTVSLGLASQAAAHAAATAKDAATATLADSLALDADQNATLHANNAARWLAETKHQEKVAADQAVVAKAQQKIAEAAAKRANTQRGIAEKAATDARQHADKARKLRVDAEQASANAVAQAQVAGSAQLAANEAIQRETAAINRMNRAGEQLKTSTNRCFAAEEEYNAITAALAKARAEAEAAGQDADAATRDLQIQADRARDAYQSALAWKNQAQAAADRARGEAEGATAAADRARTAAKAAQQNALTARKASDRAGQAAVDAVRAAESARVGAEKTRTEAEAAVREAGQAVVQADIAGDSAGSAALMASLTVDRGSTASYIASRFAAVNGDARNALTVASEAILVSQAAAQSAARRAAEADAAARHATQQATDAVGDIRPAYEAAARAVGSANTAIGAAGKAYDAAVAATNDANSATIAAGAATRWESAAWQDAAIADHAAQTAGLAAASAGRASASVDRAYAWAKNATAGIHTQAKKLADTLKGLQDEKARQDAIAREQQEFEDKVEEGILSYLACTGGMTDACKHLWALVQPSLKTALDASKNHLALLGRCYTGDRPACVEAEANGDRVEDWFVQVGAGLLEGAKGFITGLKALADCGSWIVVGTSGDYFRNNCGKTVEGFRKMPEMLRDHPLELIHINEWRENPGKAFGLTLFDVASFAIPGIGELGGALNKTLGQISNLLRFSVTKLSGGIGRIERFTVRLAEGAGDAGKFAQITGIGLKLENGAAKFDDAFALIDSKLYKVGSTTARLDGPIDAFDGAVVHLDGGVVTIENGVVKIRDLTLKVGHDVDVPDSLPACRVLKAARAAAAAVCNGTQPDGSWQYTENKVDLKLSKQVNQLADQAVADAWFAADKLSPRMKAMIEAWPGASREGWSYRLKDADSLKRKLYGDLKGDESRAAELLAKARDNIRYTAVFETKDYVAGVQAAVRELKQKRFELVEAKNDWSPQSKRLYKGINLTWRDPQTGALFELQFHTPESFWVNKAEHPFFEITRLGDKASGEIPAALAGQISKDMWSDANVPPPVDAGDLTFELGF
ncbi:hypothetical protein AB0M36_15655 [Actinoplanes sp. NPDC051346]|uniref:hypothetical protein n=1 Tax=Actinoplanes sp. NPDC051346 TaxID=3155048 RepID=UPI00343709BA